MNLTIGTKHIKPFYFSHQRGIALIMVLGLLSVMTLMAVSFAITMRTERLAAGNYLDSVNANHLIRTALHLAMADIYKRLHLVERESCSVDIVNSDIVVSNASLYPTGLQIGLHNILYSGYPIYSIYRSPTTIRIASSYGDAIAGNYIDLSQEYGLARTKIIKRASTNLFSYPPWGSFTSYSTNIVKRPVSLTNDALKYIPASLISSVSVADAASQSNYWVYVDTTVNDKSITIGRVAYIVVNCSGLLDANYAGGSPRANGADPSEIAIEYLTEIGEANKNSFIDYRSAKGPFETIPKLAEWKPSWHPSNLFCYSGFLENVWDAKRLDVGKGKVDIHGNATDLKNLKSEIISAFKGSGLTNVGEAETAYTNLIDYVDDDSFAGNEGDVVPKNIYASVEAVPMINEIMFSNSVTIIGSSNYCLANSIIIELSYPFNYANADTFKFELNANIEAAHDLNIYPKFKMQSPAVSLSSTTTCSAASFITFTLTATNYITLEPLESKPTELKWNETITKAEVILNNQIIDKLDIPLSCIITSTLPLGPTYFVSHKSKECVDPRFNWDTSSNQWSSWSINQSSIGDVNWAAKNYWASTPCPDKTMAMTVANRPLQSVGELTHLIYSTQSWSTIDPTKHDIYNYFCLEASPVTRGFVNPNTHIRDVLASAFYKVKAHTNGIDVTSREDAEIIADVIMNNKGPGYRTRQEVLSVILNPTNSIPSYIDKNILISKTENLLNVRQNLFLIIMEVNAASGGNIPANPAKQRAVAIVWRDPFRDNIYVRSLIFY